MFCGSDADLLCDHMIAGRPRKSDLKLIDLDAPAHTCDADLCEDCAQVRLEFISSTSGCEVEEQHYCPLHDTDECLVVASEEKAAGIRSTLHADMLRRKLWQVNVPEPPVPQSAPMPDNLVPIK